MNVPRAGPFGSGTARFGPRMSRLSPIRTTRSAATRSPPTPGAPDPPPSHPAPPPPPPSRGPPGAARVPDLTRPRSRPPPGPAQSPTPRHADPHPLAPGSALGDGSSPPPHLFKTTTEHDRSSLPSTSASPGPRIWPILEGFSPAGNDFLKAVFLNKTTTEQA